MPTNKVYKLNSAATTNAANIKAGTGVVYSVSVWNSVATANFVKLFDVVGVPAPATDRPAVGLPTSATVGTLTVLDYGPGGCRFDNGIGIAIVTGGADLDNTAVAVANGIKVIVNYK
jgi:hypothetical protein